MQITVEQKALLSSFTCERLSWDTNNMRLIDDFYNSRNESLVHTLQNEAMADDEEGKIAYYLIKDADGNILFFFSLKSGSLYDEHVDSNAIKLLKKLNKFVLESLLDPDTTEEEKKVFRVFQEKLRTHKGITRFDLDELPNKKQDFLEDLERELSEHITHVGTTYSAIEIVHYCKNEAADDLWDSYGLPHTMGVVFFWQFAVEKIIQARKIMGVQYLFLFAADESSDGTLLEYYSDNMDFVRDEERATAKPLYDLACEFMYQETKDLDCRRELFFEHFNPDTEEV